MCAQARPAVSAAPQLWATMDTQLQWCLHYCVTHGIDPTMYDSLFSAAVDGPDSEYTLTLVQSSNDKLAEIAKELRELWPTGMMTVKDKEYAWRDSVPNLTRRLHALWKSRKLDKYTKDDVLACARRYLSRFEQNTKGMRTLKYFISKTVRKQGYEQEESLLADLLEGVTEEAKQASWAEIFGETSIDTGEQLG